jgi:glycerophosphoryl diester phosphodiesterase
MAALIIAHRGDSAHRPENTMAAFVSALELGADILELDVQLTKDGHLAVMHDETVDRTTNGKGALRDITLADLRELSAGYPSRFGAAFADERVPLLGEVLGFLKGRGRALIELKQESISDDAESGIEALTIAAVRKAGMAGDVALISFEGRALERCRALAPEIMRGQLFQRATADELIAGAQAVQCDLVMPEKGMLSDDLVARAQAEKLKVATWVIDDPEELLALNRYNLFAVASNRPGVLLEATLETE